MTIGDAAEDRGRDLLAGPRGREVCAAVARLVDPQVLVPRDAVDRASTTRLVEQLAGLDVAAAAAWEDPLVLVDALGTSVDSARYWQAPDEQDAVLADPRVVAALGPVAEALATAPAARWWWSSAPLSQQAAVRWPEQGSITTRPPERGAAARLRRWRDETLAEEVRAGRERPLDPTASWSGHWWSTPTFAELLTTSRGLDGLPAVQLELVEDAMGWDRAQVAAVEADAGARVLEIATPSDWSELVARHPLDVDRSRRHDWYRTTGGTGPWQIPDWAQVADGHDAVHLTVAGYLAGAGRALPTERGWTVLAGFDPDVTFWLTDELTSVGRPTTWIREESDDLDHVWVRETST